MNRATPTPKGTAISMAIAEESTVTHSRLAMPNCSGVPSTFHWVDVRKLTLSLARAGRAWDSRKTAIRVTRAMTSTPAPLAVPPKRRSPSDRRPKGGGPEQRDRALSGLYVHVETPVMLGTSAQTHLSQGQERASIAAATLAWTSAGSGAYPMSCSLVCSPARRKDFRNALTSLALAGSLPLEQTIS